MLEYIVHSGKLIGIYMSTQFSAEKTKFLTPDEEPLQWGLGVFKKGAFVEPHRHVGVPAQVTEFQEFITIRRGKCLAEVFNEAGETIREFEMGPGDALLLLRGGHAFHFLEDTELLELKQGPYLGREKMKCPIERRASIRPPSPKTELHDGVSI